jgi:hypothetical protein
MDGTVGTLLIVALAVWSTRQVVHRFVDARSWLRPVLFRAGHNRVRAWMLYGPQAVLITGAAFTLYGGSSSPARTAAGLVLVTGGSALVIGALVQLRHSYAEELEIRAGYKHVSGGLFRVTDHPMRWGVLIETAGFAVITSSIWCAVLWAGLVGLILVRNRDENRMLAEFRGRTAGINTSPGTH